MPQRRVFEENVGVKLEVKNLSYQARYFAGLKTSPLLFSSLCLQASQLVRNIFKQ
jgi:hypothetical protein